jgi:hypothetical protein
MQHRALVGLALVCIALVIVSGCIEGAPSTNLPVPTPTPQIVYVTVAVPATTIIPTIAPTQASSDPILHRFIKMYRPAGNYDKTAPGEEYKFYSEGTVVYKYGTAILDEKTPITDIKMFFSISEWTGTWISLGSNQYLLKMESTSNPTAAPKIIEITYKPPYEDKEWRGRIHPAAILVDDKTIEQAKVD